MSVPFSPGDPEPFDDKRRTPILSAMLPPEKPEKEVIAWAWQREDGGRAFGFAGLYLDNRSTAEVILRNARDSATGGANASGRASHAARYRTASP